MDNVKMFLFTRWISTCYADTHIDINGNVQGSLSYDSSNSLSVLNMENGLWYKDKIEHFNNVVYPNYIKNGSVDDVKKLFDIL